MACRLSFNIAWLGVATLAMTQAGSLGSIEDLGTLGGSQTTAFSVNNSGQAAGWGTNPFGMTQGFLSTAGGLIDLSSQVGGAESYAYGLNDAGAATGNYYSGGQSHGVIWTGTGSTIDLGAGSYGTAINDAGQAVGGNGQAFIYSDGTVHQLGTLPGGNWSAAYSINSFGAVAGYGNVAPGVFRGFYWSGGSLVPIGTLGGSSSYAMDINNSNQIVGNASTRSGYFHAFLDSNGVMKDLGTLGGSSSYAYAINDGGIVVGYSTIGSGDPRAFFDYNGQLIDLNSMLPAGSGWLLMQAYGINDRNQIVGTGLFGGQEHAFELDLPGSFRFGTPEPSTYLLLLAGAAFLAILHRIRASGQP